jgi:hypothetical protein
MFSYRPCRAEPGKVRYQIPSRFLSSAGQKRYQLDAILFADGRQFLNGVGVFSFYDAAVFLYSSIERNDTKNFREKK